MNETLPKYLVAMRCPECGQSLAVRPGDEKGPTAAWCGNRAKHKRARLVEMVKENA